MARTRFSLIFSILVVLMSYGITGAEVPGSITYQGKLTGSSGTALNGNYSITFTIYDAETGGSVQWTETQSVLVTDGIFTVELGSSSLIDSSIFSTSTLWLGVQVESDAEMTPRQKLMSVPFAMMADAVSAPLDISSLGGPNVKGTDTNTGNYGELGGPVYGVKGDASSGGGTGVYGVGNEGVRGEGVYYGVYGKSSGNAGYFEGDVYVDGVLAKFSGTFIQPHAEDPAKEIRYAFFEGPEHAVFLRGTARLKDGSATIELPEHFRVVAAEAGVQVQVTPVEDCNGIFVSKKSREGFEVRELMGGASDAAFDYFITAVRAGFEGHTPVVDNTHFAPRAGETAGEFEARFAKDDMTTRAMRAMLVSNGILKADGKLNMARAEKLGWSFASEDATPDATDSEELALR